MIETVMAHLRKKKRERKREKITCCLGWIPGFLDHIMLLRKKGNKHSVLNLIL